MGEIWEKHDIVGLLCLRKRWKGVNIKGFYIKYNSYHKWANGSNCVKTDVSNMKRFEFHLIFPNSLAYQLRVCRVTLSSYAKEGGKKKE